MDLLNIGRRLLFLTALELLVLLIPASVAAAYQKDQTVEALIVSLIVRPPDALFILALLAMLATFYLFYHWVLPHAKEQFPDDLISLALGGFFFLQGCFLFTDRAVPYRFIVLSVPLLTAWYKNRRIWVRYRGTPFEEQIEDWFRKSRWTAIWTLAAGCLFALLMHPPSRPLIFGRQLAGSEPFESRFEIVVPGLCYFVFFAISVRSFLRTYQRFRAKGHQFVKILQAPLPLPSHQGWGAPDPATEIARISPHATVTPDPTTRREPVDKVRGPERPLLAEASKPEADSEHVVANQARVGRPCRPLRVFLCHSSADKPAVRDLYRHLKDEGFSPWLDEEDLIPGQIWEVEIRRAVKMADIVAACLSRTSITEAGYVHKEIRFALDVAEEQPEGSIYIIPVKLEDCSVPESLVKWHWVNLFEEKGHERLLRALRARAVALGLEQPGAR